MQFAGKLDAWTRGRVSESLPSHVQPRRTRGTTADNRKREEVSPLDVRHRRLTRKLEAFEDSRADLVRVLEIGGSAKSRQHEHATLTRMSLRK